MATYMMSIGRSFSIEAASNERSYDAWDAHPALSMPAIRQVGRDLVDTMASWFENGREHRLDTLGVQVERAIRISGPEALSAVAESPAFSQWAEGASKIDLRHRAMADVWQAALLSLQRGGVGRLRMLALALRMKPDEATAFRNVALRKGVPGGAEARRLQALGLVKKPADRLFNRATVFACMLVFSLICFIGTAVFAMPDLFHRLVLMLARTPITPKLLAFAAASPTLVVVVVGSILASVPMLLHIVLDSPELTEEGRELANLLSIVVKDQDPRPALQPVETADIAIAA